MNTGVQLITYPDSIGGSLAALHKGLGMLPPRCLSGVHILPPYPSSGDRGFAPLTHTEIDPQWGTWNDVRAIAKEYALTLDLIVNHVSAGSAEFQDVLRTGAASPHIDMFIDVAKFLQQHNASRNALQKTYRPRPTAPYTRFRCGDGIARDMWTTFSPEQIDLNWESESAWNLFRTYVSALQEAGVSVVRLDALGYVAKRPNTTSFMIPETVAVAKRFREEVPAEIQLLAEVHAEYPAQQQLLDASGIEYTYDATLALVLLHALWNGSSKRLHEWILRRGEQQVTVLDTHDGISVVDTKGVLRDTEIAATVECVQERGGTLLMRASGERAENLDVYQLNTTYFSALGEDEDAYVLARAVQLFIPGIPQVYYVGLLAGKNDTQTFTKTGVGRDVNRHNYTMKEWEHGLRQKVVQRLFNLMHIRNTHPAFGGKFTVKQKDTDTLLLHWQHDDMWAEAEVHLKTKKVVVRFVGEKGDVKEEVV